MYREMRRKDRQVSQKEAVKLLEQAEYGVLASVSEEGIPYAVPLSYIYSEDKIYFHCAAVGHKLDNIKTNPSVSFCVVGDTKVLPDKFSTKYESAVAFGKAYAVDDAAEKVFALKALIDKYSPGFKEEGSKYIANSSSKTAVVRIDIEHLTCKKRDE